MAERVESALSEDEGVGAGFEVAPLRGRRMREVGELVVEVVVVVVVLLGEDGGEAWAIGEEGMNMADLCARERTARCSSRAETGGC